MTLAFPVPHELFPVGHRFLEIDGRRIHYTDEGGEIVLLLHGNPTWSFLYRKIIVGLRDDFRCIAPDYPGFGLSAMLSPAVADEPPDLSEEEPGTGGAAAAVPAHRERYGAIQSPRPQTLTYGLTDSSAGRLRWIAEKFGESTDGGLSAVDCDQMLTNITVYWLTGTAGSSARLYYEAVRAGPGGRPPLRPCLPAWRCSRRRSRRLSGESRSCPTTSCTGPNSTAAGTSRLWRSPTCWWGTCGSSSGRSVERVRVHTGGQQNPAAAAAS